MSSAAVERDSDDVVDLTVEVVDLTAECPPTCRLRGGTSEVLTDRRNEEDRAPGSRPRRADDGGPAPATVAAQDTSHRRVKRRVATAPWMPLTDSLCAGDGRLLHNFVARGKYGQLQCTRCQMPGPRGSCTATEVEGTCSVCQETLPAGSALCQLTSRGERAISLQLWASRATGLPSVSLCGHPAHVVCSSCMSRWTTQTCHQADERMLALQQLGCPLCRG